MKLARIVSAGLVMLMSNGGAGAESGAKPFYLQEATISDVHAAYRSGATTATRLVQAYLDRIQAYDQAGPKLNVVIFLNPKALEEAAALDEHLRTTGKFVGPLHGIPMLLKDNVNTKDMPTTGGSLSLAGYSRRPTPRSRRNCAAQEPSSSQRSTCTSSRSGAKRSVRSADRHSIPMT